MPVERTDAAALTGAGQSPAKAEVINLNEVADREALSVEDQIALQDAGLRKRIGNRIVWTFIAGHIVTLTVLAGLVYLDQSNMGSHVITPDQRIITEKVIITLLGATTVQIGAIAVIIARYLFPGRGD